MKKVQLLVVLMTMGVLVKAQNVEIEGKAKITVMDTVTDVSANVVRQTDGTLALRQYKIGDVAQGGIVFYIDESGEHGLVVDIADLSIGIVWFAGTYGVTQAKGDGPFAGEMNTAIIISSHVAIGDDGFIYAARLCAELAKGGYGDWYLPSKEELSLMYNNRLTINIAALAVGGSIFPSQSYWSSTEDTADDDMNAWFQNFHNGNQAVTNKLNNFRVRAIRAF